MTVQRQPSITLAWIALIAITLASVSTAELLGNRPLAVAIIVAIAAAKGWIILSRFMEMRSAPPGIRYYLTGWTVGCAVMIAGLFWAAGG